MGRFSKQVAQKLHRAGHIAAAATLLANGWLVEGTGPGAGRSVRLQGTVFDLHTSAGLAKLASTIMKVQEARPSQPVPPKTKSRPIGQDSSTAEQERLARLVPSVVTLIEAQVAPYRQNSWFAFSAPYRLWNKVLQDRRALTDALSQRKGASAQSVAETLLREAGFGDAFRSSMDWLSGLDRCDVICDVWAALSTPSAQRWRETVGLLAAVGACPLPGREEALRRSLPGLIGRLLVAELAVNDARQVIHILFGLRRHTKDKQILQQVQAAARDEVGQHAAVLIDNLLEVWTNGASPVPLRSVTAHDDWSTLSTLDGSDPRVPDEVMRSLLEAALRQSRTHQVYALPEVEYWVHVSDPFLARLGVEQFRFIEPFPGAIRILCSPKPTVFPLEVPPQRVMGAGLYIALMGTLAYMEMVTRRERLASKTGSSIYAWHTATGTPSSGRRPVRVGRVTRSASSSRPATSGSKSHAHAVSYVVPHLRWLAVGDASENATELAAEHGIRIPEGYTFVRGHFRGEGQGMGSATYSLVDVALETVRKFQEKARKAR
ncbi:MAG TPA: hypothetical protein VK464_13135 [Symbiobacteriaceae bacterium]|nr:hypothetical protein [Symbiobacteriaceae bacterium]